MVVTNFPKPYQSAFREACFTLDGAQTDGNTDVGIFASGVAEPLGVKRLYGTGAKSVNVAPYLRRLFSPEPLCAKPHAIYEAAGRVVSCRVEVPGFSSAAVPLTFGTEDAPTDAALSARGERVVIRPGERDELSVIASGGRVEPAVLFSVGGVEHRDDSYYAFMTSKPVVMVVDADVAGATFERLTGLPAEEMTEFTVELALGEAVVRRRYAVDRTSRGGVRLAWVNRFGAVDCYTFPVVAEKRISGERTRILSAGGYRTVATASETSEVLVSDQCDTATGEWLSEIWSSPVVWRIAGSEFERVEVAKGELRCSPLHPEAVAVVVSHAVKTVSRKS